jgi:hypothetical protein
VQPLHAEHIVDIKQIASECYPEYSLIVDGSPLFAEVVAVKMRMVHKASFKIVELLVADANLIRKVRDNAKKNLEIPKNL